MHSQNNCQALHEWAHSKRRYTSPFDVAEIPKDGIYLLFEEGERAHGGDRVVRAGTHTGEGQLPSRLLQHFVNENKDRSIFRKNIGRALLNKSNDPYLAVWELDMTPAAAHKRHAKRLDSVRQQAIERRVSAYMREHFSFVFVHIASKEKRLVLESKIISTLSWCEDCKPSKGWLGAYSPKEKIHESGLWLVNELYKAPLSATDLVYLRSL